MKVSNAGEFVFYYQSGRELAAAGAPPAPERTLDGLRRMAEPITADRNEPLWDGWPVDYGAVVDELHTM